MHAHLGARIAFGAVVALLLSCAARAVTIHVQYAPGPLFYSGIDGTAKATINAAAADLSAAITTSLAAIPTDVYVGRYASTTATFDWGYGYTNPSSGTKTNIDSATVGADTVTLFVGTHTLLGSALGSGGPAGIGLSLSSFGFPSQSPLAVTDGAAQSEVAYQRGGGPVIGTLTSDFDFNGTVTSYSVDYGVAYGSVSIDNDRDDNGAPDSAAALNGYWHWDHTAPVAAGKNDLYTVALHEMLHALGVGASQSWTNLVNGTHWGGAEVESIAGSGLDLLTFDGRHAASNVMSTRISDGLPQEVVIDPTIEIGNRKQLTVLDLAFLRDIGYQTVPDYDGDGDIDVGDLATWDNGFGIDATGDANGDGDTNGADFLVWQQEYTGTLTTLRAIGVPEPSTAWLLAAGILLAIRRYPNTRSTSSSASQGSLV